MVPTSSNAWQGQSSLPRPQGIDSPILPQQSPETPIRSTSSPQATNPFELIPSQQSPLKIYRPVTDKSKDTGTVNTSSSLRQASPPVTAAASPGRTESVEPESENLRKIGKLYMNLDL